MYLDSVYDMAGLMSLQILVILDPIVGRHLGLLLPKVTRSPVGILCESLAAVRLVTLILAPVCGRNTLLANSRDSWLASGIGDGCHPL